jgi:hypothetical protein
VRLSSKLNADVTIPIASNNRPHLRRHPRAGVATQHRSETSRLRGGEVRQTRVLENEAVSARTSDLETLCKGAVTVACGFKQSADGRRERLVCDLELVDPSSTYPNDVDSPLISNLCFDGVGETIRIVDFVDARVQAALGFQ